MRGGVATMKINKLFFCNIMEGGGREEEVQKKSH